jgi:hypothetical protein
MLQRSDKIYFVWWGQVLACFVERDTYSIICSILCFKDCLHLFKNNFFSCFLYFTFSLLVFCKMEPDTCLKLEISFVVHDDVTLIQNNHKHKEYLSGTLKELCIKTRISLFSLCCFMYMKGLNSVMQCSIHS